MPRTRECDYCGSDIEPGTGTMLVFNDGATMHFCASKCEKNADLGREARSLEWTAAGQAVGGKAVKAEPEDEEEVAEVEETEDEVDEEAEADEADAESADEDEEDEE